MKQCIRRHTATISLLVVNRNSVVSTCAPFTKANNRRRRVFFFLRFFRFHFFFTILFRCVYLRSIWSSAIVWHFSTVCNCIWVGRCKCICIVRNWWSANALIHETCSMPSFCLVDSPLFYPNNVAAVFVSWIHLLSFAHSAVVVRFIRNMRPLLSNILAAFLPLSTILNIKNSMETLTLTTCVHVFDVLCCPFVCVQWSDTSLMDTHSMDNVIHTVRWIVLAFHFTLALFCRLSDVLNSHV